MIMHGEARKLQIIEAILKTDDPSVLNRLEAVLGNAATQTPQPKFSQFAGLWSTEEADSIEKAIENGCEQINSDDWK